MEKYYFRFIGPGKKKKVRIGFKMHNVNWSVPYYSEVKTIKAFDEETARDKIYKRLKHKWTGFILLKGQPN